MTEPQQTVGKMLLEAHTDLREDLAKLAETLRPQCATTVAQLSARLQETQDHILEHFRLEEEGGYLQEIREAEPRLNREIDHLYEEHAVLAKVLQGLIDDLQAETTIDDTVRKKVQSWIKHVRKHESCENLLVEDVFVLDIGDKD
ncbi:MAG: hemerythrin domain-containing protein [Gemmataceae bacterium]